MSKKQVLNSIFFVFLLAVMNQTFGQSNKSLDSLFQLLNEEKIDTIQLHVNRAIGDYYMNNNYGKAITYFEKANRIAIDLKRSNNLADNLYSIGFCYLGKADFDNSLKNYLQAATLYDSLHDLRCVANTNMSIANLGIQTMNHKMTLDYISLAEDVVIKRNDSSQLFQLADLKSQFYFKNNKFDSALYYAKISHNIALSVKDDYGITASMVALALNYKKQRKNEMAMRYIDSALLRVDTIEMLDTYAAILNNKASIYSQMGSYKQAEAIFQKSIQYAKRSMGRYIELEDYLNLSEMYNAMHNDKMQLMYLKKYYSLKDSLYTTESKNQMTQLESDFQLEKKNLEILKKDSSIKSQKNKTQVVLIVMIAVMVLLTTLFYNFKRIQTKKKLVEDKNQLISKQKEDLQNLNHVKDRLFSIISHDLRNPLNTLRSYMLLSDNENISPEKKVIFKNQTLLSIGQTGNLLDNLLTWANLQIKNTKPKIVPVAIKESVQDVFDLVRPQATQKHVEIIDKVEEVYVATDLNIISIALRNIMTNAIKFSREHSEIIIETQVIENAIRLSIIDHGVGMTENQIKNILQNRNESTFGTHGELGSGLGLFVVKELLQQLGIRLTIFSKLDEGSTFSLDIPKI